MRLGFSTKFGWILRYILVDSPHNHDEIVYDTIQDVLGIRQYFLWWS